MTTESRAQFARRLRVNRSTVNRWEAKGRLVMASPELVDVEASEQALAQRPESYRGGRAKGPKGGTAKPPQHAAPAPAISRPGEAALLALNARHDGMRLGVVHMIRPHALVVAWSVLEAGGTLEVAYAAAHLASSPLIEAGTTYLREAGHPDYQSDEPELGLPRNWTAEPNWQVLAVAAGVPFDPEGLRAYLNATPVWSNTSDDDVRRFERDITAADVT